jgi:hypothetical protein
MVDQVYRQRGTIFARKPSQDETKARIHAEMRHELARLPREKGK